jgi:hypothetical protein
MSVNRKTGEYKLVTSDYVPERDCAYYVSRPDFDELFRQSEQQPEKQPAAPSKPLPSKRRKGGGNKRAFSPEFTKEAREEYRRMRKEGWRGKAENTRVVEREW